VEKIGMMKWEPYLEKYMFNVEDIYQTYTDDDAMGSGEWKLETDNLKGHKRSITQAAMVKAGNGFATVAMVKFKEWWDFRFHVAIHI